MLISVSSTLCYHYTTDKNVCSVNLFGGSASFHFIYNELIWFYEIIRVNILARNIIFFRGGIFFRKRLHIIQSCFLSSLIVTSVRFWITRKSWRNVYLVLYMNIDVKISFKSPTSSWIILFIFVSFDLAIWFVIFRSLKSMQWQCENALIGWKM